MNPASQQHIDHGAESSLWVADGCQCRINLGS